MTDLSRYVFSKNMFNSLSHNQLSIKIDYKNSFDCDLLVKLFQLADVIVDNRSNRAKKNDAILQKHLQDPNKPQAQIYCSINGFPNPEINDTPALDGLCSGGNRACLY